MTEFTIVTKPPHSGRKTGRYELYNALAEQLENAKDGQAVSFPAFALGIVPRKTAYAFIHQAMRSRGLKVSVSLIGDNVFVSTRD